MSLIWLLVLLMRKNHIFIKDYSSHTLMCDSSDAKNDILPSTEIALLCDFPFVRKQPLKIASSSNERFLAPTFFLLLPREIFFFSHLLSSQKSCFRARSGLAWLQLRLENEFLPLLVRTVADATRRLPELSS